MQDLAFGELGPGPVGLGFMLPAHPSVLTSTLVRLTWGQVVGEWAEGSKAPAVLPLHREWFNHCVCDARLLSSVSISHPDLICF